MKKTGKLKILLVLLIIFFGLKFLSEILFEKASSERQDPELNLLKISDKIFPLSSEVNFFIGNTILKKFEKSDDFSLIGKIIKRFERSIYLNRLNFFAYFSMAKAYMSYELPNPENFEKALNSLKSASGIRPTNLSVNYEILKIYLSLWPFLSPKDMVWSGELMQKLILRINQEQFLKILEIWGLYSKDSNFIKYTINHKGRFYKEIINEMEKQELDLSLRQRFLAELENRYLINFENKFNEAKKRKTTPLSLYIYMNRDIRFFHKLAKGIKFRENKYQNLKKEINLYITKKLIEKEVESERKELFSFINYFLDDFRSIRNIEELELFLNRRKFFESNDLRIFFLKQKINFRKGQISKLINETEKFRNSVTFVKEGHENDFVRLLTLLADAYINSRLLTKALDILKEIEKISPGMLSTYWRLIKIESIIGEDDSFKNGKEEKYDLIRNSNKISLSNPEMKSTIYPYKVENILLNIDEEFAEKIRDYHLLQVFINNRIFYEHYIESMEFPIKLSIPDELKKLKFDIEIKLKK